MSRLNVDQKTVKALFADNNVDFLIPDYQRPYAWGKEECETLWDDLFGFAFPDNDSDKFKPDKEYYFLGPIVTFENDDGKQEVIDGQQRLTTLMLLLRAFFAHYGSMQDDKSLKTARQIAQCIWKTDEYGDARETNLKIESLVATDDEKGEFLNILREGWSSEMKSRYAQNYVLFRQKIQEFASKYPDYFSLLPIRIMNNCILLPILADSQDTALRIFSTLNDRGMPLSDADIFKAQLYKFYKGRDRKDEFISKWKDLEELCNGADVPLGEVFRRYMYYERAKAGVKDTTKEALRKFYENYNLLEQEGTLESVIDLTRFWRDVAAQNDERFTDKILSRLFVLKYAPNGVWTSIVSVYYLSNRDKDGHLDEDAFYQFLSRITGFIWAYAFTNPNVSALRTPVYAEMVKIVSSKEVDFEDYKFDAPHVREVLNINSRRLKRARKLTMLAWWAFQYNGQSLLTSESRFEIEHIFARERQNRDKILNNEENLESLGNAVLLEKRINIRVSDYRFDDKKKYYLGFTKNDGKIMEGTKVKELRDLAETKSDFTEDDIEARCNKIIDGFIQYLSDNGLLK